MDLWKRRNKRLVLKLNLLYFTQKFCLDTRASTSSEKGFISFSLEELKRSDSGTYKIEAENSEGKENLDVVLKVMGIYNSDKKPH